MPDEHFLEAWRPASPSGSRSTSCPAADAAEFEYEFGGNQAPSHALTDWGPAACERIREETSGRVSIQSFPASQLGSDADMLNQLRSGALEFFHLSGAILSTYVAVASVNSVGFGLNDEALALTALDGDLGAYIRSQIAQSGLVALDRIWTPGLRHMTSNSRPIRTPADMNGFRIRVPADDLRDPRPGGGTDDG